MQGRGKGLVITVCMFVCTEARAARGSWRAARWRLQGQWKGGLLSGHPQHPSTLCLSMNKPSMWFRSVGSSVCRLHSLCCIKKHCSAQFLHRHAERTEWSQKHNHLLGAGFKLGHGSLVTCAVVIFIS